MKKYSVIMAKISVEKFLAKAKSCAKHGDVTTAVELYLDVLKDYPNNKKAQQGLNLSRTLEPRLQQAPPKRSITQIVNMFSEGQLQATSQQTKNLLRYYPSSIELWNILGTSLAQLREFDTAVSAFEKCISLNPGNPSSHYNLGNVLKDQGKLKKALESYTRALELRADYDAAFNNMNVALTELGQTATKRQSDVITKYASTIKINAKTADEKFNIAFDLYSQGKLDEALSTYKEVLTIWPNHPDALNHIGVIFQDMGEHERALVSLRQAIKIEPEHARAHCGIGLSLKALNKVEAAIEAYRKSLQIDPDAPGTQHNLSYCFLSKGEFEQGFKTNESRWKTGAFRGKYLKTEKPVWNGETGKRVLVWAEQGVGDEIMFSSILSDICAVSSQIIIKCDARLIKLLQRSFPPNFVYFSKDELVPENTYDFHIPMGSLALIYRKTRNSFKKSSKGFLKHDTYKTRLIRDKLTNRYNKKIIGISWNTQSPVLDATARNITLAKLAKALNHPEYQLLSLQYGDVSSEIEAVKNNFGIQIVQFNDIDNKDDLDGLSSLIMACDEIVSTTNVTVHLAGALGAKATALLPYSPRWIWGLGSDSYWYDSVTPVKQNSPKNWSDVLDKVRLT